MRRISKWILRWLGWKVIGGIPPDLNKAILIVMPHTSNWDFPLGILVRLSRGWRIKYLAKASLFRFPLGYLFRALGGYPVNRSGNLRFVEAVIRHFEHEQHFIITITPEGTRSAVSKLRSGYYYIAKGAGVPLIMTRFDFKNKEVVFAEPLYVDQLTKDQVENEYFLSFFGNTYGKNPYQTWDKLVATLSPEHK